MENRIISRKIFTKENILIIMFSLVGIIVGAEEITDLSLNGLWSFRISDNRGEFPDSLVDGILVNVPHTYNSMSELADYAGTAVYERELPVNNLMKNKQLRVEFGAVYHDAEIYINGVKAGEHRNAGYTPFSVDITPYVYFDRKDNRITVITDNSYSSTNLPFERSFDWNNDGGIYRDVNLHVSGPLSIRYVHVTPQLNIVDSTATARFDMRLWNENVPHMVDVSFDVVYKKTGDIIAKVHKTQLKADKNGIFSFTINCGKVFPWHFDNPNLYTFTARIYCDDDVSDTLIDNFGFRTIAIDGNRLLLNGESVRLPGIEDMPGSNPLMGAAENKKYMAETVSHMKELNCALTRYHWAQDEYRIHLMDSLGMLVQEEISWWGSPEKLSPELQKTIRNQLSELIEAHYNHPSIYAWGLSNEVGDNAEELRSLRNYAVALDSTRIYLAMSNGMNKRLTSDPSCVLDIPTYNDYIGTWHSNDRTVLAATMDKIGASIAGRPLLITEAGLCEPVFPGGDARRIDDMIYHIREWQRNDFIIGYIYFCLEDYRTQMGEEGIGINRIRRHGVMTKNLQPKPSFGVLQHLMSPIEILRVQPAGEKENTSSLKNRYSLDRLSNGVEIWLRNKNSIPKYTVKGYAVVYTDCNGLSHTVPLKTLSPGEETKVVLSEINDEYHFEIVRNDGSIVMHY